MTQQGQPAWPLTVFLAAAGLVVGFGGAGAWMGERHKADVAALAAKPFPKEPDAGGHRNLQGKAVTAAEEIAELRQLRLTVENELDKARNIITAIDGKIAAAQARAVPALGEPVAKRAIRSGPGPKVPAFLFQTIDAAEVLAVGPHPYDYRDGGGPRPCGEPIGYPPAYKADVERRIARPGDAKAASAGLYGKFLVAVAEWLPASRLPWVVGALVMRESIRLDLPVGFWAEDRKELVRMARAVAGLDALFGHMASPFADGPPVAPAPAGGGP